MSLAPARLRQIARQATPTHWSRRLSHNHPLMAAERKQKSELRTEIRERLSRLSQAEIDEQSRRAQNTIIELPEFQKARRVGVYLCMPSGEAQTYSLVETAFHHGKEVFVPYLHDEQTSSGLESDGDNSVAKAKKKRKAMSMLRLRSHDEYQRLEPDSWGIPSLPAADLKSRENAMGGRGLADNADHEDFGGLDLIVVPGVAFDLDLNRMGHGAGFYDKYFARFCGGPQPPRPKPYLVGLCLAEQVLPPGKKLIMQEWDWKVDAVAVGDGRFLTLTNRR